MDSKSIGLCPQGFESPRCRFVAACGERFRSRRVVQMTPAGLEPAIPGSVGRCLIHWATGPLVICKAHWCVAPACVFAVCMLGSRSVCSVLRLRCFARRCPCRVRLCVCVCVCVCVCACVCVCVPWSRVLRAKDTLAEWLMRWFAKPMGSPRAGSNPTGVGLQVAALRRFSSAKVGAQKRGCSGN
jgi:hypothetical protein